VVASTLASPINVPPGESDIKVPGTLKLSSNAPEACQGAVLTRVAVVRFPDVAAQLPRLGNEERRRLTVAAQCDGETPLSRLTDSQRASFTSSLLALRHRLPT
jgi:hypothetical protein